MNLVHRQVGEIVRKEINYLTKLYPYNVKRFLDSKMLHASNIFSFYENSTRLEDKFYGKLLNLMAGMELLSAGIKLHSFNPDDFIMLVKDLNLIPQDKNYTLDLLFGDVFYSRAAVYILDYNDSELFNSILDSLKSVHSNKLLLHQKLVDLLKANNDFLSYKKDNKNFRRADPAQNVIQQEAYLENKVSGIIEDNETLLTGMNSLLKTAFFTGWGIFSHFQDMRFPYSIISDFILFKTFNDLKDFFTGLPVEFNFLKNLSYVESRKKTIKNNLAGKINDLSPAWLKENFLFLQRLYAA